MNWMKDIKEIPSKYKPHPFWSWNDKLETPMLKWQIQKMNEVGIGGFFMHARGGLKVPFMGDEWMEYTKQCIEEAQKYAMDAWCYDEEGWPSGCAGGRVTQKDESHYMQWLELEGAKVSKKSTKYYVDLLNAECVASFLDEIHEKYKKTLPEYFNHRLTGFFTDEPQYSRNKIPWSPVLEKEFKNRYDYDINEKLSLLFLNQEGYQQVRYDYWNLVSELFTNSFMKQVSQWCESNNTQLTGHLMLEENLYDQMSATAGVMPSYEYMDMPGIDWLTRSIGNPVTPKQVSSVAEQLGKDRVLTETFALCGWGVTFEEMKWIAEWQFVNGVNMLCQHLEGYSLRGCRKRDYPPGLFYQQPWWEEYLIFNEYFSRLGMLLRSGEMQTNVLCIHPMKTAFIEFDGERDSLTIYDEKLDELSTLLNDIQVLWHFGDETIIKKYGMCENGQIQIGKCNYSAVVLPFCETLDETTVKLLLAFAKEGGKIVTIYPLPTLVNAKPSILLEELKKYVIQTKDLKRELEELRFLDIHIEEKNTKNIHYTQKKYGKEALYYFVNLNKHKEVSTKIFIKNRKEIALLDIETMSYENILFEKEKDGISFQLEFAPMQSYILVTGVDDLKEQKQDFEKICLKGEGVIEQIDDNAITLDFCEYRLNHGEWQPKLAIINLMNQLIKNKAEGLLEMKFVFESQIDLEHVSLVLENPEKFSILFNGEIQSIEDEGWWIDHSFRKIFLKNVKKGRNELLLSCQYFQRQKVYDVLLDNQMHESERNKLTLDTELESIYLVGKFGVFSRDAFTFGERKTVFTGENLYLDKIPETLKYSEFTNQGFPFFAGKMSISSNIEINHSKNVRLDLSNLNAVVAVCYVNDKLVRKVAWAPYDVDITDYVVKGTNKITIELYNSCRNLLGPHHHIDGECYQVSTASFGSVPDWAEEGKAESIWRDDGYCFVKFGFDN